MHAPRNTSPKGLRGWWTSPARSGPQLIIAPWEYRHLRAFARVRIASGIVLASLGLVTLSFGGNDSKTYAWTMAFLAGAAGEIGIVTLGCLVPRSSNRSRCASLARDGNSVMPAVGMSARCSAGR